MRNKRMSHTKPTQTEPQGGKTLPKITPETLRAVRDGDDAAFETVYLNCFAPLVRFLEVLTHDSEEAREMAQNIFLRIYENRHRINPEDNFRGYLLRSAKVEFYKLLDKKKVREKFETHTFHSADVFDLAPDELLISKELSLVIRIYIENMPPQRQKIFRMSRMDGMGIDEIAGELNLSRNTVRNQLQAGKEGLREILTLFLLLFVSQ